LYLKQKDSCYLSELRRHGDRLEGKPIQETNVNVTRRLVDELTDDELAERIASIIGRARAASTIEGSCEETTDSQEPDGVVPVLRIRAG
jgi:hypothetical protein